MLVFWLSQLIHCIIFHREEKKLQKSEERVIKREHCLNFSLVDMSYLIYINVLGNRLCTFGDLNYPSFLDYKYRYLEVCYDYLSSQNEQDHYNFLDWMKRSLFSVNNWNNQTLNSVKIIRLVFLHSPSLYTIRYTYSQPTHIIIDQLEIELCRPFMLVDWCMFIHQEITE